MEHKKPTVSLGYTDRLGLLMDASDIIVTKPGGLTSSEALAKGLPMVVVNPIPGQEERNRDFLLNSGVAVIPDEAVTVGGLISTLLGDPARLSEMRAAARRIGKPNAVRDICDRLESEAAQR